jgi:hypothetical protein
MGPGDGSDKVLILVTRLLRLIPCPRSRCTNPSSLLKPNAIDLHRSYPSPPLPEIPEWIPTSGFYYKPSVDRVRRSRMILDTRMVEFRSPSPNVLIQLALFVGLMPGVWSDQFLARWFLGSGTCGRFYCPLMDRGVDSGEEGRFSRSLGRTGGVARLGVLRLRSWGIGIGGLEGKIGCSGGSDRFGSGVMGLG